MFLARIGGLVHQLVLPRSRCPFCDRPLSALRLPYERYWASGERNHRVADPAALIESVADHYGSVSQDRLDGLTVEFGGWWFNLRPSNTEPLLRLNLEAGDAAEGAAHLAEVEKLLHVSD